MGGPAKIAIILQAGAETHEGMARALHSLLYTRELHERGVAVQLVFDGAGTEWAAKLHTPESPQEKGLATLFAGLRDEGVVYEICDFCSGAFAVRDRLTEAGVPLSGKYMNHPSIADLVVDGYQLVTL